MKSKRATGLVLLLLSSLLFGLFGIGEVSTSSNTYVPIKWALIEIDTRNDGLDNYTGTKYTQDLANIIRSFGFPFDVYRHQDLTSTTLQFANGTIKYQVIVLERPDSLTISEPTVEQKNWIRWAIGNGTNALFIKRSIQYFNDIFDGTITSVSATSVTFNFTRDFAGYATRKTGNVTPTENIFLTLSSFAVDATEIIRGNYSTTFGAFLLNRTYALGKAWFLAERAVDNEINGVMPHNATRTAFYHVLINELPKVPVYILPWQRYGSAHAFRVDDNPSPLMLNSTVPVESRKFFDSLVAEAESLRSYGYPATMFAITWGGNPPGSAQLVMLNTTEPPGYTNIPSVHGHRFFGNLSRAGNTTGYKIVIYNSTAGGNYDTFKVDADGDKDWGDEAPLRPGQNFTWYCEYCDYETTAFLAYREAGWTGVPTTFHFYRYIPYAVSFWTYIPITHQHPELAGSWSQIKNFVIDLVDNYGWDIGLQGTDHAPRYADEYWLKQWTFANGTDWPVDYAQDRLQCALDLLQQEFGARVKRIMADPNNPKGGVTPQVRQALLNLGFICETTVPYGDWRHFPYYRFPNSPLMVQAYFVESPSEGYQRTSLTWEYRGLHVSAFMPTTGDTTRLNSKMNWMNSAFQTNRSPYTFAYNETSMWVTTVYEATMFYYHSMQMLRNVRTAYWTGDKIVIEFTASPNLENFVWRFPVECDGKGFYSFSDNRTVGEVVKVDGDSVFVEFSQGQGGHRIEVTYPSQFCTLDISATEGGTTDPAPGTYSYPAGTVVSITANSSTNYVLDYWLLDGVSPGDSNSISVTMDEDHVLEAVFTREPYFFDPSDYYTIREAEYANTSYWVGSPGAFFDNETGAFWLVYRYRAPSPYRGHTLVIANSTDGIHFTDVWYASKYELECNSIARSAILKDPNTGMFKLYISKGEPWKIYKLEDVWDPTDFDVSTAYPVLTQGEPGEWDSYFGVFYAWVRWIEDRYVMLYSGMDPESPHPLRLGLATSLDGETWTKHPDNPILDIGTAGAWDDRRAGTGSIMFLPDYWAVYYSGTRYGGTDERDMKTGLAVWSPPPPPYRELEKITVDAPLIEGIDPQFKSLWNLDTITAQGRTFFYYTTGTINGSMDLRVTVVERARMTKSFSTTTAYLNDVVTVTIKPYLALPYTSVTLVDRLPGELTYLGGFSDNLVPNATPTINNNTLTYTTNKTGEHIITFTAKVTEVYDHKETLTNTAEATYQATHYADAVITASANLTLYGVTLYIKPDGTVDPPTPLISKVGDVYTFTDNIFGRIVVKRSNITIDGNGYTLHGSGVDKGLFIWKCTGVIVKNITVKEFSEGVSLWESVNSTIFGNTATSNGLYGINLLEFSNNNVISGNNITDNGVAGVHLYKSSNNIISGNNASNDYVGIRLATDSFDNTISGNIIMYNEWCGIRLGSSHRNTISVNNITKNGEKGGIRIYESFNNTVSGNNITDNVFYGIRLYASVNNTISSNNVTKHARTGIQLEQPGSNHNTILDNTVTDSGWHGIELYMFNNNNAIIGNTIRNSSLNGIHLYRCSNNTISNNTITDSGSFGVELFESNDNTLSGNIITGSNETGVKLGTSHRNSIYHNNFINNKKHASVSASSLNNTWDDGYPSGGNYWSDYTGIDEYSGPDQNETGSDGVGDTPYIIDENNQDRYPLMEPFIARAHDIAVTNITSSKTVVGQGYTVSIEVTVENQGDYNETFSIAIYANTLAIDIKPATLISGSSTTIEFTWNTTGFAEGNYTISAYATPVPVEVETADNTYVDGTVLVTIPGDVNGDKTVDILDAGLISAHWYPGPPVGPLGYSPNADINNDGAVNIADVAIVNAHWLESW